MDVRLRDLYEDLCDELYDLFRRILECEEKESVSIRYRGHDVYEGSRDTGRIIIGSENGEDFSYAYRLRFDSKPNKPNQISWRSSNKDFSDLSILLGEDKYIIDDVLSLYAQRTDAVSHDDVEYVENLFEQIESRRQSIQREYDIKDVKKMIENREVDKLQNIISPSRSSDVEIWKMMFSYNRAGDVVENNIDFPYIDNSKILARGERTYCSGDNVKNYPVGLVIEETEQLNKFFIHRIPRTEKLDDYNYNWTESDLQRILGYESNYIPNNGDLIPENKKVRIGRNLTVEKKSYDKEIRSYRHELFSDIQEVLHTVYYRSYRNAKSIDLTGLDARITSNGLRIDDDCSNSEVKDIQNELGINESDVRSQQRKRNIGRLSSNLRSDIIKDLYMEKFCDWLFERSYHEIKEFQLEYEENSHRDISRAVPRHLCGLNVEDKLTDFIIQDPSDMSKKGLYNLVKHLSEEAFTGSDEEFFLHDDMKLRTTNSTDYTYGVRIKGYDESVIERIIIPESSKMIIENEGNQRSYVLSKGVYVFRQLNRIRTIRYSSNS